MKSAYLTAALLDHLYGGPDYTRPATVYLALFDADGVELSGAGYARAAVTNNATNWPAASGGGKANGPAIAFPAATDDWAEAVAWGLYDAATDGNSLWNGPLTAPATVTAGQTARFPAGALTLTEG